MPPRNTAAKANNKKAQPQQAKKADAAPVFAPATTSSKKAATPTNAAAAAHEAPKYAPPQPSIFAEYLWFPFYDTFVKLYPRWFSPNGITLFGIFATLFASVMLLAAMPVSLQPFGAPAAAPVPTTTLVSNHEAGSSFVETFKISLTPPTDLADKKTFSVAASDRLAALRARGYDASAPANIYGKKICPFSEAAARVATEAYEIATEGAISTPPAATPKQTADGQPLLGLANQYDFHRPALFYESLECPFARFEVAFALAWRSAFTYYFFIEEKLIGYRATDYRRQRFSGAVEEPLRGYYYSAKEATAAFFAEHVRPQLEKFVPAEILSAPGRVMLIIAGLLNLVYCVADNTDGRHARRTKKSSFVGEYLDHGLDCVTSLLTTYLLASALGMEGAQAAVALLAVAVVTIMSHVVNQEKGFMIWGNRLFTVDEAMLAFGFGMIVVGVCPSWIPALVPAQSLAAAAGIPIEYIPTALAHARIGEFLWFGFLLSQVSVMFTLLCVDPTVFFRPSSAFLVANVAGVAHLTATVPQATLLHSAAFRKAVGSADVAVAALHPASRFVVTEVLPRLPGSLVEYLQGLDAALSMLFSYEASWVILAACTCSLVIHAPIFAKCYKMARGTLNTSYLIAVPLSVFTFFFVSAGLGALIAVLSHAIQVRINVGRLNARGRALLKQQKAAAQKN